MQQTDKVFETSRLHIRELRDADLLEFHEMQSDDVVMRFTTGHGFDKEENRRQLQTCIASYTKPNNDFWVWAIIRTSDDRFLGTCAIVSSREGPEIGYRLLRKYFGLGYGQEVCNALIDYGIQAQRLQTLVAYADIRNVASVKILDRSILRFVKEVTNNDGGRDRFYRWASDV